VVSFRRRYGRGVRARDEDEDKAQASPTSPAKLPMLPQGRGRLKEGRLRFEIVSATVWVQLPDNTNPERAPQTTQRLLPIYYS